MPIWALLVSSEIVVRMANPVKIQSCSGLCINITIGTNPVSAAVMGKKDEVRIPLNRAIEENVIAIASDVVAIAKCRCRLVSSRKLLIACRDIAAGKKKNWSFTPEGWQIQ